MALSDRDYMREDHSKSSGSNTSSIGYGLGFRVENSTQWKLGICIEWEPLASWIEPKLTVFLISVKISGGFISN